MTRKVDLLLAIGILLMPVIFGWFTLREGYSNLARTITFIWMYVSVVYASAIIKFVLIMAAISIGSYSGPKDPPTKSINSTAKNTTTQPNLEKIEKTSNKPDWKINFYIDKFGDPTDKSYMSYQDLITGYFSNSATEKSRLYVRFSVNSKNDITIFLHEYSVNNLVKESRKVKYLVDIKTDQGEKNLIGYNYHDRISLDSPSSHILHQNFMRNIPIKFYITKDSYYDRLTHYSFTFKGSRHYPKVYRDFQKGK
ncbi:MAG: hypothetical protein OXC40_03520 [Proteobacteria bacterium]|nr:hypothetical protein [Pseudomonadota bacterium]